MIGPLLIRRESRTHVRVGFDVKPARRLPALTAVVFLLPILLLYWQVGGPSGLVADPSTGVHVRTGQWILAHQRVPRYDLFSFTLPQKTWCDWEWLSDLIFACAYRFHGLSEVAGLSLALLCLLAVVIYRTARARAGPTVAGAVCGLVMATTTIHWLARPHLFTWLALAVFCCLLERDGDQRRLWAPAVVMLFWVNLHPGFVAGFLVLGAYLAASALERRFSEGREDGNYYSRQVVWCSVAMVACGAVTLVNPYGFELHRHILSYLFSPSTVTAHVSEWMSPNFQNPRLAWFEILLPLAAAAGVWHALKRHFYWCLLIFGFMHLALQSVRNVPLLAIVCAAPLAVAAEEVVTRSTLGVSLHAARIILESTKSRLATASVWIVAFAVLGVASVSPVRLGQGIPVAAIRHLPPGRLFTTDQWADYLIYAEPGHRVFFDGWNDFYGRAFVESYLRVMKAELGWETILEKYYVSVAMVPTDSAIGAALSADSDWGQRYHDAEACVFVRTDSNGHSLFRATRPGPKRVETNQDRPGPDF